LVVLQQLEGHSLETPGFGNLLCATVANSSIQVFSVFRCDKGLLRT
ncbi:unnamed protein product, partial [Staurois parvus]